MNDCEGSPCGDDGALPAPADACANVHRVTVEMDPGYRFFRLYINGEYVGEAEAVDRHGHFWDSEVRVPVVREDVIEARHDGMDAAKDAMLSTCRKWGMLP